MVRLPSTTMLIAIAAGVALVSGAWGWAAQAEALRLTPLDVAFRALGGVLLLWFYPDSDGAFHDWRIELARFATVALFALIATKAVAALLQRQLAERAARRASGHLLVLGDHPLARATAEAASAAGERAVWLTDGTGPAPDLPHVTIVRRPHDAAQLSRLAPADARRALVAFADEVRQLAVARELRRQAPDLPILVNMDDAWLGERLDELEQLRGVRVVSELAEAVRALHWRRPPFEIARALGHQRLHALILGFGEAGEAVLSDLLLSQATSFLGLPRVTIVDPRAEEIRAGLAQRRPELGESAEIDVLDPGQWRDERLLPREALVAAASIAPFTAAWVCLTPDRRALGASLALAALARREVWRMGAVHALVRTPGALPPDTPGDLAAELADPAGPRVIPFGTVEDFARSLQLFEPDPERLAAFLHDAYRAAAPADAPGNRPWAELSEEQRDSNRRQLAHLPAKLASIGVDWNAWLRGTPLVLPDLDARPDLLDRLAELEHARWSVERRLNGWRHGPVRDAARRTHPGLAPWSSAPEEVRMLDRVLVRAALEAFARSGQGLRP
jgi:hypothetical protein